MTKSKIIFINIRFMKVKISIDSALHLSEMEPNGIGITEMISVIGHRSYFQT